ncbi:MAG: L,D-transpeptidase family protein [Pseudomonadota bacterium]
MTVHPNQDKKRWQRPTRGVVGTLTRRSRRHVEAQNRRRAGTAWVRRSPRNGAHDQHLGVLCLAGRVFPCALGRGGVSSRKREGDGATPRAAMRVLTRYARPDRTWQRPASWTPIRSTMGWCDAPFTANYNRPINLPWHGSHEVLLRHDALYDRIIVLDWNITCRVHGRGSAIFFHQARVTGAKLQPTEGCIALPPQTMRKLVPILERLERLVVV